MGNKIDIGYDPTNLEQRMNEYVYERLSYHKNTATVLFVISNCIIFEVRDLNNLKYDYIAYCSDTLLDEYGNYMLKIFNNIKADIPNVNSILIIGKVFGGNNYLSKRQSVTYDHSINYIVFKIRITIKKDGHKKNYYIDNENIINYVHDNKILTAVNFVY